jgi:hypothetical protein
MRARAAHSCVGQQDPWYQNGRGAETHHLGHILRQAGALTSTSILAHAVSHFGKLPDRHGIFARFDDRAWATHSASWGSAWQPGTAAY